MRPQAGDRTGSPDRQAASRRARGSRDGCVRPKDRASGTRLRDRSLARRRRHCPPLRRAGWRGCGHPRSARQCPAAAWARRSRSGSHEKGSSSLRRFRLKSAVASPSRGGAGSGRDDRVRQGRLMRHVLVAPAGRRAGPPRHLARLFLRRPQRGPPAMCSTSKASPPCTEGHWRVTAAAAGHGRGRSQRGLSA